MTKQEKIKHVYGGQWDRLKDKIDDNGWSTEKLSYEGADGDTYGFFDCNSQTFNGVTMYRPFDLVGIENNNGWFKIEKQDGLYPAGLYWVVMEITTSDSMKFKVVVPYTANEPFTDWPQPSERVRYTHYDLIVRPTKLPLY
ncbi:hypothetical protein [Flavobacterium sp. CAU 1735]|uniref:hypothetical protein n=1 Tax=Flavobacterium sp. CAU 1735 TaxID=3140361 RepID=UPI0032608B9A